MKIRPIPSTDLANIALLSASEKETHLRVLKAGWPSLTYKPFRRFEADLLNIEAGPLGIVPRAPWEQLEERIRCECKSEDEIAANVAVAAAVYRLATEAGITGRRHNDFFPLAIGHYRKLSYWVDAILRLEGRATALFTDPRISPKLTEKGRLFTFSVMHDRIRQAGGDYREVALAIVQFAKDASKTKLVRTPRIYYADGVDLVDFDAIDAGVREAYEIWTTILGERETEARRSATGPWFGRDTA